MKHVKTWLARAVGAESDLELVKDTRSDLKGYDFMDFGASKGGSIDFALRRLGGTRGLGVDLDSNKVKTMLDAGYDCIQADVNKLDFPPDSVRFVTMSHFLEHLSNLRAVKSAVESASRVASDFLFIQGPYFDADEYLRARGLKFYWSDWHGHTCHLTTSKLREILLELGLEDHTFMVRGAVEDSSDPRIHPVSSPKDQHAYDPDSHPVKPFVPFPEPLPSEVVCCVRLREMDGWDRILQARKGCRRLDAGAEKQGRPSPAKTSSDASASKKRPFSGEAGNSGRLNEVIQRLMLVRRWSYLRYLHMREGLIHARGVESVLAVGCGRGYAELALALEFPDIRFHLTDIEGERTPNYQVARSLAERWDLGNVTFGVRDIMLPEREKHDLVASVEVLEHIENDALAAARMREAAAKYVFALVPFADEVANADEALRERVYESHEHYRVGYNEETLRRLFTGIVAMRGCYWKEKGGAFRQRLHSMTDEEIKANILGLQAKAQDDIVEVVPTRYPDAQGIWMLNEV